MDLQNYYDLLVSLEKTINLAKKAELVDCVADLQDMYDLINDYLCEAIDMTNEIKQEKGADND